MQNLERSARHFKGTFIFCVLTVLLIFITSGCAFKVKLVGEYDEIIDKSVTELQESTVTFFSIMESASDVDRTYENNKKFYADTEGKLSALILRSEIIEGGLKINPLTRNLKDLKAQYAELKTTHLNEKNNNKAPSKKYFQSAEKAFNQSFRAILENLLYLKWNQTQPKSSN